MATTYSVKDQLEALNRHDPDAFAGFYARDAAVYDPQHPEPLRGEAIRKDIGDFLAAFPDLTFTLKTVLESGDTIAFDGTGKGTHKGPMAGPTGEIPPTNRAVEMAFAAFLRVNDQGQITEERRYFDVASMMQQLGLMS